MRTIIAISLLILLAAVACGTETEPVATTEPTATTPTDTAQDSDRATLLKETTQLGGDAFARREWAIAHTLYPNEFRAKCSLSDFAALMTFGWAFLGIPEDSSYVLDGVRIDGDNGWIDSHWEKDGVPFDLDDDEGVTDEEPEWVWQDSKWVVYVSPEELAKENPCSLDFTAEDTPTTPITPTPTATPEPTAMPTPTATPEPVLGSRENPAPLGVTIETKGEEIPEDHFEIVVIDVVPDATSMVLAENQFNDPPESGNQFFMVTLRAKYLGPGSTTFDGGFRLRAVGNEGIVYTTFEDSCGVVPNELPDPELFTNGTIEGTECWQIASSDADSLIMFLDEHPLSFTGERVWFSLNDMSTPTSTPTPTATPEPTAMPTPTATPETISISEATAQGYTREEEPCSNRQQFPDLYSNVPHEELENGMCAFYYPPR